MILSHIFNPLLHFSCTCIKLTSFSSPSIIAGSLTLPLYAAKSMGFKLSEYLFTLKNNHEILNYIQQSAVTALNRGARENSSEFECIPYSVALKNSAFNRCQRCSNKYSWSVKNFEKKECTRTGTFKLLQLVMPRSGDQYFRKEWPNSFCQRASHSLFLPAHILVETLSVQARS